MSHGPAGAAADGAAAARCIPVDRPVVLVGMMGAGKSTIGRRLAERLGLPFVDADQEVERAAGCSIPDIFATYGEQVFRDGERRVIRRLVEGPPTVVATGGGAFNDQRTRDAVARHGISVWLRADVEVLYRRVAKRHNRPLLAQGDVRETLRRLLAERQGFYASADVTVNSGEGPAEDTVEAVIAALARWYADRMPANETNDGATGR